MSDDADSADILCKPGHEFKHGMGVLFADLIHI
jgi:hypothetical protein